MYPVAVILQYTIQYNTIQYNTQNNTYTLKIIHNTKITIFVCSLSIHAVK